MLKQQIFRIFTIITALVLAQAASAEDWAVSADLELQLRGFAEDPRWPGQEDQNLQSAITASADLHWQSDDGKQRISFVPVARWDEIDSERKLFDLQEAYWAIETRNVEILLGVDKVFWGVTEAVHLVDIINQTDTLADIDGEDKLGQPMLRLSTEESWGQATLFVLPFFRERNFAGAEGRLRSPFIVNKDLATYTSSEEENHIDWAFRYSQFFGDFDLGLSYFSGTSREANFIPGAANEAWRPHYDQIKQIGLDLQYTGDAWLWKLEAIHRESSSDTFWASVAGFEYTAYQIFSSTADLGFLAEYLYDQRAETEPLTTNDNDIFAGMRLALNDTQDTSVLAGIIYDHHTNARLYNVEFERRLGEHFVIDARLRVFSASDKDSAISAFAKDDYLEVSIKRYF